MSMTVDFTGKRALVTGAGKGIGREVAIALSKCGAKVVVISRTKADLDSLSQEIPCETICADIEDVKEATEAATKAGDIDLLVNNAGIAILEPFLNTSVDHFDKVMNINVRAQFIIGQTIAKNMISRGKGGSIVNVSSQASMIALKDHTAYCTSKGALDSLTRMMALELGPHQIRVNAVNPTVTMTAMGKLGWSDPVVSAPVLKRISLGRFAEVSEVASVILFLLSDLAAFVHGSCLPVDGGFLSN
eukprot:TRINITY_DN1632_c0_g1_i3.p1 TRINITY_DN1632_c0_g1~~TRINITY_DN1632_c0_g1_i3.p1  ORF type:complete len:246 (+),score=67.92 TRINITY_DN1632_c0_g1_i3:97-834(+)